MGKEYGGRVAFARLNTDGNPNTARRLRISSIPALLLFQDGKLVARTGGYQSDAQLRARLDRYAPPPNGVTTSRPAERRAGLLSRMFGGG
jgi:thioredoxin-like negative regulator of GroEL